MGSYYGAKTYVNHYRFRSAKKATVKEIIIRGGYVLLFCLIMSGFIEYENNRAEYFFISLIAMSVPAIWGCWEVFENDGKLNEKQRRERMVKTEAEEKFFSQFHDDRY